MKRPSLKDIRPIVVRDYVTLIEDINADLLEALEHIAFKPLGQDPRASAADCLEEATKIARAAIAKAKAGKE